jgi:tRNA threonylcarbamoyladenosine biosynthesis protein TsaB
MKLLAIDTATEACSAAIAVDAQTLERFELEPRHGERILPMVEELLAETGLALTQLDAIAFGRGPGSFTSLRIGAGVVQGLAYGADVPVLPVSSLAALAQGVDAPAVLAAFDARMGQVYWGAYRRGAHGLVELSGAEVVADPARVPLPEGGGWHGAGTGWDAYHAALIARVAAVLQGWSAQQYPHASAVAQLAVADFNAGRGLAPEQALPVYLRDDVAKAKGAGRGQ